MDKSYDKRYLLQAIDFDVNPLDMNGDYIRKGCPDFSRVF